ncbi:type IV secretion system protein VirB1 [Bordetella ansorpii]|uniref:Type IV secretion system protein VirB1 n=1 Tax=Bordetella ansorpii TaxID=288768 RepID=A0A157QLH3_9BORD|nr:lytic transglycosylase domain-containing protein [Bordetella ansorpii]SAI46454.1 type IV secretion system protein VirB1 [Bordetella ansorpii]
MIDLAALALACAPHVDLNTLTAVVNHESSAHPYAIGVNGSKPRSIYPASYEEAVATAQALQNDGVDFDAGLGSINVRNWSWLDLDIETVFDPCANLQAVQTVLADCYQRAAKKYAPGDPALVAALSCYNTGTFTRGVSNGYVRKLLAGTDAPKPVKVPAIGGLVKGSKAASAVASDETGRDHTAKQPADIEAQAQDVFADPVPDAMMTPHTLPSTPHAADRDPQ